MTEINSILTRSFAEAHEPADGGFSLAVAAAVARRERVAKLGSALQAGAFAVAGAAVLYALFPLVWNSGQDLLASFGLGFARAQGALNAEAPLIAGQAQGVVQSFGAGLTQLMLITAVLAGGAVAYRTAQE